MSSGRRRHARIVALNRALLRFERRLEDALLSHLRRLSWHVAERWTTGSELLVAEWLDEFERSVMQTVRDQVLAIAMAFGQDALKHIEDVIAQKSSRDVFHSALRLWIDDYTFAKTLTLTQAIREEVQKALTRSVRLGEDERALAKRLAKAVRGSHKAKEAINKIARTQAHMASEIGSYQAARSTGLDIVKEWAANEDMRTRMAHAIANGQIRELNAPFEVGGEHLMHPGDPQGSAKQVVNCRCISLYHPRINGEIIR